MPNGEKAGVRQSIERMTARLQKAGMSREKARTTAVQSAKRLEREGRVKR